MVALAMLFLVGLGFALFAVFHFSLDENRVYKVKRGVGEDGSETEESTLIRRATWSRADRRGVWRHRPLTFSKTSMALSAAASLFCFGAALWLASRLIEK